jgi:hypothetical protein
LAIKFPTERDDLKKVALDFQEKSSNGMLDGCVAALDGWLCRIKVPSATETANIASYFSGHYQWSGVNDQAICNAKCRFTYLSVRSTLCCIIHCIYKIIPFMSFLPMLLGFKVLAFHQTR